MKKHKLGIIVPYRNRPKQLNTFTERIASFLDIPYELIIVEQADEREFNRGKLLNIGFLKAMELQCDYVVFHDIDMLPVKADYSYSNKPIHLISEFDLPEEVNRQLFDDYFGGVTLFPSNIFKQINGYTNEYFGWGFEDDNLLLRCKENQIKLDSKKVIQKSRDGIGLQFDGKKSLVAVRNVLNIVRNFSIVVNFTVDEIVNSKKEITDEFSVFSIPGFDTALTYNSFRNFTFQFWDKYLTSHALTSEHFPEGTYTAVITINNRSSKFKSVSFYLNGELIKTEPYERLSSIKGQRLLYLGVGDPERTKKPNYFKGKINTFCIYENILDEFTIANLSNNIDFSAFNFSGASDLKVYYDAKFVKGNSLIDLSGNYNDGTVVGCEQVVTKVCKEKEIQIPSRREGVFEVLPHDENGYKDGYWVNWASRENQMDYYTKYYNKKTNYQSDGLSTCKFKEVESISNGNLHKYKVSL
tara:strand:- start:2686 stop:4095 length:1410 start_codon:yes stop_codon:yes gene_type:complete